MIRFVLPALLLSACGGASGGRADTILALTGDATAGEPLFASNCALCHGADGTGGSGPDLTGESVGAEVVNTILNGKEAMPAFDTLADQDIADIVAWMDANVFQ